jgi:hypothetical protein
VTFRLSSFLSVKPGEVNLRDTEDREDAQRFKVSNPESLRAVSVPSVPAVVKD